MQELAASVLDHVEVWCDRSEILRGLSWLLDVDLLNVLRALLLLALVIDRAASDLKLWVLLLWSRLFSGL